MSKAKAAESEQVIPAAMESTPADPPETTDGAGDSTIARPEATAQSVGGDVDLPHMGDEELHQSLEVRYLAISQNPDTDIQLEAHQQR